MNKKDNKTTMLLCKLCLHEDGNKIIIYIKHTVRPENIFGNKYVFDSAELDINGNNKTVSSIETPFISQYDNNFNFLKDTVYNYF